MSPRDDLHTWNAGTVGAPQEQHEQAALVGNALRLQELFVALWEAKRGGQPFACSLHGDGADPRHSA